MPERNLSEQFPFQSRELIWRQLRALVSALDAKFDALNAVATTFEDEVDKFEELGLTQLNAAISPLVEAAIEKLTSVVDIFTAQSPTENTVGTGAMQFVVPGEERWTFAPLTWVAIYADGADPVAGMIARVDSWDDATGTLEVTATISEGSGTYTDWTITTSAPPSAAGVSQGQMDTAISNAINALKGAAPAGLDTLVELAAALGNNASYAASVTAALALKLDASAWTAAAGAVAGLTPQANYFPYFTGASSASLVQISAYMRSIMNTADVNALKTLIAAASLNTEDQTLTGGARVSTKDLGTKSSGTVTPDPGDRPMQSYTNGGAHTLAPGTNVGSYLLDITNSASAGTITTSGWTKVVGSFTTTSGHKFRCACSVGVGGSLLQIQALQ